MPITYNSKLSINAIDQFSALALENSPRTSCLIIRVLIDIVRNQGSSPADVMERTTGDRNSSAAEKLIKLLESWEYIELLELSGVERVGKTARREIYLTPHGAGSLYLKPA